MLLFYITEEMFANIHKYSSGKNVLRVKMQKELKRLPQALPHKCCFELTNAGATISVHAEAFAALTVVGARCVNTRLLASSIELLTLIYI